MAERLSADIWYQIFFEACTDGGRTACALSRVSQYFRDVVLPLQLDNVSLIGIRNIDCFAALLQSREMHPELCRVQHLFLWIEAKNEALTRRKLRPALRYILGKTAPGLITFTDGVPQRMDEDGHILDFTFPMLRELTIRSPKKKSKFVTRPNREPSFPSLRYLHVMSSSKNAYAYTQYASNLTHLRLPIKEREISPQLREAIQFVVKPDVAATEPRDQTTLLLPLPLKFVPTLEKIFIEARWLYTPRGVWSDSENAQSQWLENILNLDEKKKIVLISDGTFPPGSDDLRDSLQKTAQKNWEERIVGGPGCWIEPS